MKLILRGTVWSVQTRTGRKKDGTEFQTASVAILQEGQTSPAIVKMDPDLVPEKGEVVEMMVYPSGWVANNGKVNIDLRLSGV